MAEKQQRIKARLEGSRVLAAFKGEAQALYDQSRFGEKADDDVQYSFLEAMFLLEKGKIEVKEGKKALKKDSFMKLANADDRNFWIKYAVFRDIRHRGYIVKTALKFGADFRVYERGIKPGEDHAKWIVYPVHESGTMTWHDFAAKNRVAHSTKKRLLLGIVDDEGEVTYYEVKWVRP